MAEGEQQDDAQKTEEPTPKKLEEARKKGQIALSREINNWVMLLTGTVLVGAYAPYFMAELTDVIKIYISKSHTIEGTPGGMEIALGRGAIEVLRLLLFPFIILLCAAFMGPFIQVGPLFAPEAIKPQLSKISIMKGFKRLFSLRSLMEFAKGLMKISIVSIVSVIILYPYFDRFEHLIDSPIDVVLEELQVLVIMLLIGVLIVMTVIAGIDLVFQQNQHQKQMRMTKQEVKDEYKQTQGDPQVKSRLRQLRMERGRQRMMAAVPEADVVITNPTHYSIALKYNPEEMDAPICVAKGVDEVAMRIREVAKEHDIVLYENKPLARALWDTVEIDEIIPMEHYKAVAEVISFVFKMRKGVAG